MFAKAIVRTVPETIAAGITSANLGRPDYEKALEQHEHYVGVLERCGLEVIVLGAYERYLDSVFVEDTAVVSDRCVGFGASFVGLRRFLHLKTGVAYLGGDDLVVAGELVANDEFECFGKITVTPEEEYCANCIRVNAPVLLAAVYERTKEKIAERGYEVFELEISEFRKVDGRWSCPSLRLPIRLPAPGGWER